MLLLPQQISEAMPIGGKAKGLIKLLQCGANVPSFAVLPASAFHSWIDLSAWKSFCAARTKESRKEASTRR